MQYSDQDIKFLKALKAQGVPADQAFQRLNAIKSPPAPQSQSGGGQNLQMFGGKSSQGATPIRPQDGGFSLGGALQGFSNMGVQAGSEIMRGAGNILSTAGQIVDPITNINRLSRTLQGKFEDDGGSVIPRDFQLIERGTGAIADLANKGADINKKASMAITGKNENDPSTWGGQMLGGGAIDFGASALGGGYASKLGGAGMGALGKFLGGTKAAQTASPLIQKGAEIASKGVQNLGRIAGETQGYMATDGNLATPQDVAAAASIEGGLNLLTRGGAGLAKNFLGGLPRFTPAQKGAAAGATFNRVKDLMYDNVKDIPLSGNPQKWLSKFKPLQKESIAKVDDIISRAQSGGAKTTTIDNLRKGLIDKLSTQEALQTAGIPLDLHATALAGAKTAEDYYINLLGKTDLNLPQLQELKKSLNKVGGDKLVAFTDQFRKGLQGRTREFIENQVGDTLGEAAKKELKNQNLNYNAFKMLNNNLKQKGSYSGFLTDTLAATSAAADNIAKGDIAGAAKAAIIGVALKRAATSAPAKIAFAKIVKATENPAAKLILRTIFKQPQQKRTKEL